MLEIYLGGMQYLEYDKSADRVIERLRREWPIPKLKTETNASILLRKFNKKFIPFVFLNSFKKVDDINVTHQINIAP